MANGDSIQINFGDLAGVASNIDGYNNDLYDKLQRCKSTVHDLSEVWQGEAAEQTIQAFDEFSKKYSENYKEVIDSYVQFLNNIVHSGYTEAETKNVKLADAFKG